MQYPSAIKLIAFLILIAEFSIIALALFLFLPLANKGLEFQINKGEDFGVIAQKLEDAGAVRSIWGLKLAEKISGGGNMVKAGKYKLEKDYGPFALVELLGNGPKKIIVRIPEGSTLVDVDRIFSEAGLLKKGTLFLLSQRLEGYLFPDTYEFYAGQPLGEMLEVINANFNSKTKDILPAGQEGDKAIILASILEKEVQTEEDMRIVAGILLKRMSSGMRLQVDATLCYDKQFATMGEWKDCYPITEEDKNSKSPMNTYRNHGLPPGPIGNPSLSAIKAALDPASSSYLFYLSAPNGETIFSQNYEEHKKNISIYLR